MQYLLAVAILVVLLLAAVWDIAAGYRGQAAETVSSVLQAWSIAWPVLPLAVGVILGHVFWPQIFSR